MYGIPKTLQTHADFLECEALVESGNAAPRALLRHYQGLLAGRYHYAFDRPLAEGEPLDGVAPDYLLIDDAETGTRTQLRRTERGDGALGFSWAEIEQRITHLEAQ